MEQINVYRNKKYFLRILLYALLLLIMCVYGYIARYNRHSTWDGVMLVLTVIFGLIALMQLRRTILALTDKNPVLVISREGILDRASYIQAGLIPWNYISSAKADMFKGSLCLYILTRNTESFLEQLPRMKKGLGERYAEMAGTPVIIHKNIIRADIQSLADQINAFLQKREQESF